MPDLEEKTAELKRESSSAAEETTSSLNQVLKPSANAELLKVISPESAPSQKVKLKKHVAVVPSESASAVAAAAPEAGLAMVAPTPTTVPTYLKGEIAAHLPETVLETEMSFVLDRKRIPLAVLSTLAEGEVMALSGTDFKATLFLQDKAIAEAQLIMVDQQPSIQITKIYE